MSAPSAHPVFAGVREVGDPRATIDRPQLDSTLDGANFNPPSAAMTPTIAGQLSRGQADLRLRDVLKTELGGVLSSQATDHQRVGIGGHRYR